MKPSLVFTEWMMLTFMRRNMRSYVPCLRTWTNDELAFGTDHHVNKTAFSSAFGPPPISIAAAALLTTIHRKAGIISIQKRNVFSRGTLNPSVAIVSSVCTTFFACCMPDLDGLGK
jgi:hypothetical protein